MARKVEFDKFLIIECTARELYIAVGSPGICDNCAEPSANGYYIAVLNRWLCPDCYEKWKEYAHWYPEDVDVENKNFEFYAPRLGVRCQ